jgi:hypothetical protein
MAQDTSKVADRRVLTFASFAEVGADLDRLEAAERAGTLRHTGNWTPGQVFTHLAAFMAYPFDGYPPELANPPWIIRFILKLSKGRYLYKRMPAGLKIPGIPAGTVGARDVPCAQGLAELRRHMQRLDQIAPSNPSPIFGPMTHEEWKSLNLRHCELHLGFLHP